MGLPPNFVYDENVKLRAEIERLKQENKQLTAAAQVDMIEQYKKQSGGPPLDLPMSAWDARYSGSAKEIEDHTIERCARTNIFAIAKEALSCVTEITEERREAIARSIALDAQEAILSLKFRCEIANHPEHQDDKDAEWSGLVICF